MDNIVIDSSSESDSDFSDVSGGHSEREEEIYDSENFMNHVNKKEYEINRNKLFTRDLETIDILVESSDSINNYTYKLFSEDSSSGGHGEYKNVIGFNLIKACVGQRNNSQEHLLDICVPNIVYKSCIHNSESRHVIGRMCMNKGARLLNEYEPEIIEDNYFFPTTLHDIEIDLKYKDTNLTTWSDYDSDRHNSFVFRLTILKNLDLLK